MARRDLLAEAQVQAAAQTAPQVAALSEALTQARADRNSAIRAAAAANAGIAHAIHLAGPAVKAGYTGAQKLAAPPQGYSDERYGRAAGSEQRLGTTALASSLANSLKELSDRRISAAAGRAYATSKAQADYAGNAASIASKRQALASQEGLLTASALSKLTEAMAGRKNQRLMQERSIASAQTIAANTQAAEDARLLSSQSFTASENAAGRKFKHHEDAAGRKFTAGQNAAKLAADAAKAQKKAAQAPKPTATELKGRQNIQILKDHYDSTGDMSKAAADARKQGYPEPVIGAAADLHSKGYVTPQNVQKLKVLGYSVPKEWTGVQVRPHTRKRRSP